MLATGGSLCDALHAIKAKNPTRIISLNIIGSPDGVARVRACFPDVDLFIAKIDERLENGYITPGIGDAGDRAFNTL
jgi:uracil phosphoribosyltransferase